LCGNSRSPTLFCGGKGGLVEKWGEQGDLKAREGGEKRPQKRRREVGAWWLFGGVW